jgi:hypothetical protein
VCEWACSALGNFAASDPDNHRRIAQLGGVALLVRAMAEDHKTEGAVQREAARALWHVLSTTELHTQYMTPAIADAVRRQAKMFPFMQNLKLCLASLTRAEHSAVTRAKAKGICTLMTAPHCSSGACPAMHGMHCAHCAIPQRLFLCLSCDGGSMAVGDLARHCEICWTKYHAGHLGLELFRPGTCDQHLKPNAENV